MGPRTRFQSPVKINLLVVKSSVLLKAMFVKKIVVSVFGAQRLISRKRATSRISICIMINLPSSSNQLFFEIVRNQDVSLAPPPPGFEARPGYVRKLPVTWG